MSVTSTESKLADHKYVLERYLYYKTLSKDLLRCNEENEQELHMTKKKLELKNLELNDAMSHLEEKSKEIEDMKFEMQNLKTAMNKMKNAYENVEEENRIFSSEIIDLKSKLEEISLSNKAKLLALECMQNDSKKRQVVQTSDDIVSNLHVEDLGKCDSWWCPKHSNLLKISKELKIKTIKDKVEKDMALKRQKHWCRQGQRTVSQVKKCWHNIKTKRKSEITSHKQAVLRTGGGPAVEKLVENPLIDKFANIACEIPGAIDSDRIASHNITCVTTSDGYLEFNIQPSDDNLSDSNINDTDANFTNAVPSTSIEKQVELPRQYLKNKKSNLSAETTSRVERVEIQKINDEEIHNLLKEELLLKIENERELLKRRKIETEVASNDLIFRKEKHLTEMELLKRTIKE